MKIVHISGTKLFSGAGRGVLWLHQGLQKLGLNSKVLSQEISEEQLAEEQDVYSLIGPDKATWLRQRLLPRIDRLLLLPYGVINKRLFSPGVVGNNISHHPLVRQADIVHLHWVNNGMLGVKDIVSINKPIVWTVRDMWPFTGGCHYSLECEKYTTGCGACPVLKSSTVNDLSSRRFSAKQAAFGALPIVWAPISPWVADCLQASPIYNPDTHSIRQIMNCVNMDNFFPEDKLAARLRLGIPADGRKIILSGAINSSNPYKGFSHYQRAVDFLESNKSNYHFVFFGQVEPSALQRFAGRCTSLGYIQDDALLRSAYVAADVFVAPSIQEAFGKTLVEAMACGTPVVCFDATGTGALVEHEVSGYTATSFEPASLAQGIRYICELSTVNYQIMADTARLLAVKRFSAENVAREYHALYQQILSTS